PGRGVATLKTVAHGRTGDSAIFLITRPGSPSAENRDRNEPIVPQVDGDEEEGSLWRRPNRAIPRWCRRPPGQPLRHRHQPRSGPPARGVAEGPETVAVGSGENPAQKRTQCAGN